MQPVVPYTVRMMGKFTADLVSDVCIGFGKRWHRKAQEALQFLDDAARLRVRGEGNEAAIFGSHEGLPGS